MILDIKNSIKDLFLIIICFLNAHSWTMDYNWVADLEKQIPTLLADPITRQDTLSLLTSGQCCTTPILDMGNKALFTDAVIEPMVKSYRVLEDLEQSEKFSELLPYNSQKIASGLLQEHKKIVETAGFSHLIFLENSKNYTAHEIAIVLAGFYLMQEFKSPKSTKEQKKKWQDLYQKKQAIIQNDGLKIANGFIQKVLGITVAQQV